MLTFKRQLKSPCSALLDPRSSNAHGPPACLASPTGGSWQASDMVATVTMIRVQRGQGGRGQPWCGTWQEQQLWGGHQAGSRKVPRAGWSAGMREPHGDKFGGASGLSPLPAGPVGHFLELISALVLEMLSWSLFCC